jgi:hypothetical protein
MLFHQPHVGYATVPEQSKSIARTLLRWLKKKSLWNSYAALLLYLVIENIFDADTNFRLDTVTYSLYTR